MFFSFAKSVICLNVLTLLILLAFSSINGDFLVFSYMQPLRSGPFIFFDPDINFNFGSDISAIRPLSLSALSATNLVVFAIAWLSICITTCSLSETDISYKVALPTFGFLFELFFIGVLIQGVSWSFSSLLLPAGIFVFSVFFALKNFSRIRESMHAISFGVSSKRTKWTAFILAVALLSLTIMLPTAFSGYSQLSIVFFFEVYLLITWNVILVFVFGLGLWLSLRNYVTPTAAMDMCDLLAIFPIGLFSLSVVTLVLLEFRLFSIFGLFIVSAFMLLYIQFKFSLVIVLKDLFNVFTKHAIQIFCLSLLTVFVLLLYLWGTDWLSLQWFDMWHWWGNAYQEAVTGTIYDRYSLLFPGTTGMLSSGFITSTIVLLPDKIVTLFYMRTIPIMITVLQVIFIFNINRFLIQTYFQKHVSTTMLGVIAFLSSSWTLFYGTYYTRESINILLVLLLMLFVFSRSRKFPENNESNSSFHHTVAIVTLLGSVTIYFSEIEWLFIYPSIIISLIVLVRRVAISRWVSCVVSFLLGSLSTLPYFLIKLRSYLLFTQFSVKEMVPNLDVVYITQSSSSQSYLDIFSSLTPSFNISNLDSIPRIFGYSVINSLGLFGFAVALVGVVYVGPKLLRKNLEQVFVVFGILLICFPLILFFWPTAAILLDLRRRFVPQLSIFLAICFSIGVAYMLNKLPSRPLRHSLAVILLSVVVFSQGVYPMHSISHMSFDSQTEVSRIMLQLDKILPSDFVIVADATLIDQAEGLLSPRYVVRGAFFATLFDQIPGNETQLSALQNYIGSGNVAILAMPSPYSVLKTIVDNVASLNASLVPLGNVRLLLDNSYRTFVAILSNKTVERDLGNNFQLTSNNVSTWRRDIAFDGLYEENQSRHWNMSARIGWHDLFIPFKNATNINKFDVVGVSLELENRTNLIHIFMRDSLHRRLLVYVGSSISLGSLQLMLDPERPIFEDPGFNSSDVVEMVIAHLNTEDIPGTAVAIREIYGFSTMLDSCEVDNNPST